MKDQDSTPIVPQRKIDADELQNKINLMPKVEEIKKNSDISSAKENGLKISKKGGVLDGAVSITGGPTIRSIKNMRNKQDFKFKMKHKKKYQNKNKNKKLESIKMPKPVQKIQKQQLNINPILVQQKIIQHMPIQKSSIQKIPIIKTENKNIPILKKSNYIPFNSYQYKQIPQAKVAIAPKTNPIVSYKQSNIIK